MSIRSAASCGHPLQDKAEPRGARMVRVPIVMNNNFVNACESRATEKNGK
jgi:hypothetical protein